MSIPIEEDLKELLSYQFDCKKFHCDETCPLRLLHKNEKYDYRCLRIILWDIFEPDKSIASQIDPDEFAMWVRIIAHKHVNIRCKAGITVCKKCKLTQFESPDFLCGANKFNDYITRELP